MARSSDITAEMTLAEAAAWLTTLQDQGRTPAMETAFQQWMTADPTHARAFAQLTDIWDVLPGAVAFEDVGESQRRARPPRTMAYAMAACLAICLLAGIVLLQLTAGPVYRTGIGQQQSLALADGSRVALNTDSKLQVAYSENERRVRLDHGEVLFTVAKNPARPFIVEAGNERIRAVGTSFVVRSDSGRIVVTLLEGKVEITRVRGALAPAKIAVLTPGERLTTSSMASNATLPAIDRPRLEAVTAWRQGNVMFDDETLGHAIDEINRYGGAKLEIEDRALATLKISGIFAIQDPLQFAQLAAQVHRLNVTRNSDKIELGK